MEGEYTLHWGPRVPGCGQTWEPGFVLHGGRVHGGLEWEEDPGTNEFEANNVAVFLCVKGL